ncbi:MAG: FtsX-like permease family protein, partial [Terriglobia bacterium]
GRRSWPLSGLATNPEESPAYKSHRTRYLRRHRKYHFHHGLLGPVQVVGVVGHVKHWGLDSDDTAKIRDEIYFPLIQIPDKFMSVGVAGLTMMIRTAPDPLALIPELRRAIAGPTEDQPMYAVETMNQIISESLEERRFTMLLLIIFASTALVLASVGIYGVMSYAVSRRTHEIGVRLALGATRGEVLLMVLREGMTLAAVGTVLGVAAAMAVTRLLASLLYGVKPADPLTLVAVAVALALVAAIASYAPARRATRVDPVSALRCD